MYLHFVPAPVRLLLARYTWRRESAGKKVLYLTFDDGPVPEITPAVLQILDQFSAKATFFCVGDNVRKHPDIFQQLISGGHRVGNHTYHHLNGGKTDTLQYISDVQQCSAELEKYSRSPGKLFRPPYGRIRRKQASHLLKDYEIVLWDVLSADFDTSLPRDQCLQKSIRYSRSGSIIVFHDNPKAWSTLSWVLPRYLEHFSAKGYTFECL